MIIREVIINRSVNRGAICVEKASELSWVICVGKTVDFRNLWLT